MQRMRLMPIDKGKNVSAYEGSFIGHSFLYYTSMSTEEAEMCYTCFQSLLQYTIFRMTRCCGLWSDIFRSDELLLNS